MQDRFDDDSIILATTAANEVSAFRLHDLLKSSGLSTLEDFLEACATNSDSISDAVMDADPIERVEGNETSGFHNLNLSYPNAIPLFELFGRAAKNKKSPRP